MSLSSRIALGVALVLTLTLMILGITMVGATRTTLTREIDDRLLNSVKRVETFRDPWDKTKQDGRGGKAGLGDHPPLPNIGVIRSQDQGVVISAVPGNRSPDKAADLDVAITKPADDEHDESEGDTDVFVPDIVGRNVALIVVGPRGNKVEEYPTGYEGAPDSLPALPAISGPEAAAQMKTFLNLPSIDGSIHYRVLVWPGPTGSTIITAASLQPVEDAVRDLVRTLVVAGLLGLAVASLISWWVIRQGLRPVDRMVETAAAIAEGDLSRRVPDADPETELGRLGTALNEMLGQIEAGIRERDAAEARLRRFIADAAHELRTPLTSLRGYAELYRQGALPTTDAVGNAMGRIESEGARMARLVDDLLLLARTDQGRALEKEPVDLVRLAREAAGDFAAADPKRPLTRDLEGSAVVIGDPIRLRQAIDNLLTNVRAHTPANTPVRVSVRRNGTWAEVTVADDGPGISEQDQQRIFERFWRGDPARGRTAAGGAGLGLSIVDALVRSHGGSVAVRSVPGDGTAFTLRLPLAPPDETANRPDGEVASPSDRLVPSLSLSRERG